MNRNILIVDDEEDIREILNELLTSQGFKVLQAQDGQEALNRLLGDTEIEMVVTDIHMPKMSGMDLLKKIRMSLGEKTRVYIMTGGGLEQREEAIRSGANGFMEKSEVFTHFLEKIGSITT